MDGLKTRKAQNAQEISVIKEGHNGEMHWQAHKDELSKVFQGVQQELAATYAAPERTRLELQNAAEEHERLFEKTEGVLLSKRLEISEAIKRNTARLDVSGCLT